MPRKLPAHVAELVTMYEDTYSTSPAYFARCTCTWFSFPYTCRYLAQFAADEHLKANDPGTGWVEVELPASDIAQEVQPS